MPRKQWVYLMWAVLLCGSLLASPGRLADLQAAGESVSPILDQLAPNTTLHTLEIEYRRHGPASDTIRAKGHPEPEALYAEMWLQFDESGKLFHLRAEKRGLDGTVYSRTASEGADMVFFGPSGEESRRLRGALDVIDVESLKTAIADGFARAAAEMDAEPDAPTQTLDGILVKVLENRRELRSTRSVATEQPEGGATIEGFTIPYIVDLNPVARIERSYMSVEERREILWEIVAVDAMGKETVVESKEPLVVEVLAAQ